jgi:two-component system, OmpR family, KDP operon response regulator KdpE
MNNNPVKVLIVVEDASLRSKLRRTLNALGFDIREASDVESALVHNSMVMYEAVLLHLPMSNVDGVTVCRLLRRLHPCLPVIVLSARNTLDFKVAMLEAGADDFLARPFAARELVARLRSVIRRCRVPAIGIREPLAVGDVVLDPSQRRVEKSGTEVSLTPTEFHTLQILMEHAGTPVTHAALVTMIWGEKRIQQQENLRVVISALRKKLGDDPSHPAYLLTHNTFGYSFRNR